MKYHNKNKISNQGINHKELHTSLQVSPFNYGK